MEIKTKFNIDDKVFILDSDNTSIKEVAVKMIHVSDVGVSYSVVDTDYTVVREYQAFASKEELLEKLKESLD